MTYSPHAEFAKLYKIYTSDPDSMGQHSSTLPIE